MPGYRHNIEECPLNKQTQCKKSPRSLRGPLRVVKLCILGIILPAILLGVPLYMRYRVYGHQLYPLAMSDMRLLDNKVSTTWCQRQLVKVNTTFNAFLLPEAPHMSSNLQHLSMVRHLVLEDDTKEYWGFYLLAGSSVTVSSCVRWPGASLIVIKGHKHLHECAYIGDNSSEELDELMEAIKEGTYVAPNNRTSEKPKGEKAPANEPDLMKRHREDVEFHHPIHKNSSSKHTINKIVDTTDVSDPKVIKQILDALQEKTNRKVKNVSLIMKDHQHIKRNSTIAKDEVNNVNIEHSVHEKNTTNNSQEVLKDIIKKLEAMGEKGSDILKKVNNQFKNKPNQKNVDNHILNVVGRHYSKPAVDFADSIDNARRRKRDLIIQTAMASQLVDDDEHNDQGIEEGFTPDGIADHRGTVNETTLNDMSNSEFWSSFSSSEEALLNCAGLILNLPLTPHHNCNANLTQDEAEETYLANSVTYKVPSNGYYFFVFSSENEVQPNYIRVQFRLKKTVYNVSNPVEVCKNTSETCAVNLKFFSSEKLVMELPVKDNETLWNEEFVVVSECEPRTAIYIVSVLTVPVLVLLFAFS
ncbi:uncharacterized protein LOC109595790 isoform X2 [Aethina tumida]|uniref:uncharacterized protein LOC109595790 isoform X2 n=1 Tax=Aethina tumida TaxID=116153 RepID=UPI0021486666|nr:uncharacterized protein LOC109595790 isoform X2 [Aethina tumida]